MKTMKALLATLLALTMVLALCACGTDTKTEDSDTNSTTANNPPVDNGNTPEDPVISDPDPVEYFYTVTVQDTKGNPIPNVNVQICAGDSCVPKKTDENGVAGYDKAIEGNGELTAKLIALPQGYVGMTEICMEGETDIIFKLTNVADLVYMVKVQDTEGNAIPDLNVQICAGESCVPKRTDANGIAGFDKAIEGNEERTAKLINVPAGYTVADGSMEIPMGDETEVVFILQKNT